jgi:hypothetical protein
VAGLGGLPVARILEAEPVELELWLRITRRSDSLIAQLVKAQAAHNAASISQLFKRR